MKKQQNIVILGGGTAGWMSANLLHLKLAQHSFKIRVIESPDIGIIGVGNGYVFSSKYKSFNDAESEFCEHLNLNPKETSFRRIKMQVGQVAKHWSGNCVAVGLAQGFIEPLEATTLHLVQETVTQFLQDQCALFE
jgi:2-polyprenyl-6-methoxyphenol hydroxylase-like FAD-dependent oxidoreductase